MGRQSKHSTKKHETQSRGKMKLMCLAILLLGLSCLVESQRPTGRPGGRPTGRPVGRPNPQEMCANTMELFMDLGWAGPTDEAPCPNAKAMWKFMLGRWDADGSKCLSAEEFAQMGEDLELGGPVEDIFNRLDRDEDGCLEFREWRGFVREFARYVNVYKHNKVEHPAK